MANSTDNLPSEVTLAMPRVYRGYLAQKRVRVLMQTALSLALAYAALCIVFHWKAGSVTPHVVGLLATIAFGGKLSELRPKTWHYTLDEKEFRLVWWTNYQRGGWYWYDLNWQRDSIVRVEQEEWRGLPLLRIVTDDATPNVVMVYAPGDADIVANVVLPLIEKYRKQYRHEFWIDQYRQEKQTL